MPKQFKTVNLPDDFYDEIQADAKLVALKLGLRTLSIAQLLEMAYRKFKELEAIND